MGTNWYAQEEDLGARGDVYEVLVRFTVVAPNPEEAEAAINDIIREGKLRLLDEEDRDPIYEYDICDTDISAL